LVAIRGKHPYPVVQPQPVGPQRTSEGFRILSELPEADAPHSVDAGRGFWEDIGAALQEPQRCQGNIQTSILSFHNQHATFSRPSRREKIRNLRARFLGARRLLRDRRSEEHTSELQSRFELVCRLLLEKYIYSSDSSRYL